MVELVRGYEKEFLQHFSSTNKKLAGYESSINKESSLTDIKHGISQAENSLRNMEKEILSLSPQEAKPFGSRVIKYQENLLIMKKSAKELDYKKNKVDLLGKKEDTREKLLSGNEILQESGDLLEGVLKTCEETQDIGYKTTNTLKEQRITIQNINDKVNDVGTNLGKANQVVSEMNSRGL